MFELTPRFRSKLACGVFLLVASLSVNTQAAEPPAQPKNKTVITRPSNGWETDDGVRRSMSAIQQAMASRQQDIAADRLGAQDYQGLAKSIEENLAVAEKSSQAPVASLKAFQAIVAIDLRRSAELMRTGATVKLQRAGALGVPQTLNNYGQYFQHPGWVVAK